MSEVNNDVVIIQLDRPRELRFGHKALKRIAALKGNEKDAEDDELSLTRLEEMYFWGLQRDARENGEILTMEQMEDLLDYAESTEYLMKKMAESMQKAMGSIEGNAMPAGQLPGNQPQKSHGTGRSR